MPAHSSEDLNSLPRVQFEEHDKLKLQQAGWSSESKEHN